MLKRKARSYAGGEKLATHRELGEMSMAHQGVSRFCCIIRMFGVALYCTDIISKNNIELHSRGNTGAWVYAHEMRERMHFG
jgi:hypothetical protein